MAVEAPQKQESEEQPKETIVTGRVHVEPVPDDADDSTNYVLKCQSTPYRAIHCQTLNLNGEHPYHAPVGTEIGVHPDASIRLVYEPECRDGGHVTIYPDHREV